MRNITLIIPYTSWQHFIILVISCLILISIASVDFSSRHNSSMKQFERYLKSISDDAEEQRTQKIRNFDISKLMNAKGEVINIQENVTRDANLQNVSRDKIFEDRQNLYKQTCQELKNSPEKYKTINLTNFLDKVVAEEISSKWDYIKNLAEFDNVPGNIEYYWGFGGG